MAKPILAMFPGQGSQFERMGSYLVEQFPYSKEIFEEADDTLKISISKLCCQPEQSYDLQKTIYQQPCILTTSIASWTVLRRECDFNASFFAGHSLGEYSALVASDKISFSTAVELVHTRGKAMQDAVPLGKGSMAAVLKCNRKELSKLCSELSENSDDIVEVVNFNSPQQQIISGKTSSVDKVCEILKEKKILTIKLKVSAPFHSSLMTKAREEMDNALSQTKINANESIIIPNLTATPVKDYDNKLLIDQIDSPVLWEDSLLKSYDLGVKTYIELSPGKTLSGLAKKTLPGDINISNCTNLEKLILDINNEAL